MSVVTPTLNRRALLQWTLRSVRGQTYPNLEHIVVDGGSTDGTIDLLAEYEQTYSLRWISEADHGMYEAINKGLKLASGEILAYLNSDDLYFPWTVAAVSDGFARNPEADFLFGDAAKVDETTGRHELYFTAPFNLDFIRRVGFLVQPTVFMRRAAFESLGPFDETLRFVADCEYWMRAGERHMFVKVNEFLAVERNHSSTLRESEGPAVSAELKAVRSRFVRLTGAVNNRLVRWHRARNRMWLVAFWLVFLVQTIVPSRLRRGPWRHFLDSKQVTVKRRWILPRLIPGLGRSFSDQVVSPSRYWLEPNG